MTTFEQYVRNCALRIKDEIIDWLDPKPITYRDDAQARISFEEGYLSEPYVSRGTIIVKAERLTEAAIALH